MDAAAPIVARFRAGLADMPKHARLRAAIVEAVESGELAVGAKMVGERELAEALGVSLGTTQKALGRLMQEGFLVRRQGRGTFVGTSREPVPGSWHYRFLDETGAQLPVYATLLERELVKRAGPWSDALGPDPQGFVWLRRAIDVGGRLTCASDMYLPATRFGRLLRIAERRLADVNLKVVLEREFASPTLSSQGVARVVALEARDRRVMSVAPGTWGMQVDIVGRSLGRAAITFQRMLVPPSPCGLKLDFGPPNAGDAA
jgi:GntR family transcriptional regulator